MGTIPNGHNPNGHDPEWTKSRMEIIPNGYNLEWALLPMYSFLSVVNECQVSTFLQDVFNAFIKKLIFCLT